MTRFRSVAFYLLCILLVTILTSPRYAAAGPSAEEVRGSVEHWREYLSSYSAPVHMILDDPGSLLNRVRKGVAIFLRRNHLDQYMALYEEARAYQHLAEQELAYARIMLERGQVDAAVRARDDAALYIRITKLLDDAALQVWEGNLGKAQQQLYEIGKAINDTAGLAGKTIQAVGKLTGQPGLQVGGAALAYGATGLNWVLDSAFKDVRTATRNAVIGKAAGMIVEQAAETLARSGLKVPEEVAGEMGFAAGWSYKAVKWTRSMVALVASDKQVLAPQELLDLVERELRAAGRPANEVTEVVTQLSDAQYARLLQTTSQLSVVGKDFSAAAQQGKTTGPAPVQGAAGTEDGESLAHVVQVAAGFRHSLAVSADGTVWAWGENLFGEEGREGGDPRFPMTQGLNNVIMVAAGEYHSLALRRDGTVWAWGYNWVRTSEHRRRPVQVQGLDDVITVAAGDRHSLALRRDGTVWAWGNNHHGQLGDGTQEDRAEPVRVSSLDDVIAIAAGGSHSLALRADGTVWAWGLNRYGQLGDGTTTYDRATPVQVLTLADVVGVAAGYDHSLALRRDGTVWAWGNNHHGQLGDGTQEDRAEPVRVSSLDDVIAVAAGGSHSLALRADGTVWAWGGNGLGQLGDGTSENRLEPVQVRGLDDVVAIAAGGSRSIAVRSDGTVWQWGYLCGVFTDSPPYIYANDYSSTPVQLRRFPWARN